MIMIFYEHIIENLSFPIIYHLSRKNVKISYEFKLKIYYNELGNRVIGFNVFSDYLHLNLYCLTIWVIIYFWFSPQHLSAN